MNILNKVFIGNLVALLAFFELGLSYAQQVPLHSGNVQPPQGQTRYGLQSEINTSTDCITIVSQPEYLFIQTSNDKALQGVRMVCPADHPVLNGYFLDTYHTVGVFGGIDSIRLRHAAYCCTWTHKFKEVPSTTP